MLNHKQEIDSNIRITKKQIRVSYQQFKNLYYSSNIWKIIHSLDSKTKRTQKQMSKKILLMPSR
jgi:hypothetical protein